MNNFKTFKEFQDFYYSKCYWLDVVSAFFDFLITTHTEEYKTNSFTMVLTDTENRYLEYWLNRDPQACQFKTKYENGIKIYSFPQDFKVNLIVVRSHDSKLL